MSSQSPCPPSASVAVGVDVGGTFTDVIVWEAGRVRVHKLPTTPQDQSVAVAEGVAALGAPAAADVVHGTTTATNALLERAGARTALVATEGFRDVLAIGRQARSDLYALAASRPAPLVPPELRFGLPERTGPDGEPLVPLDTAALDALAERLAGLDIDSVAVVLLHAYRAPENERRVAAALAARLGAVPITLSSDVLPEHREYERASTTAINAYVRPLVADYLARLGERLAPRRVRVMQSNGGGAGLEKASRQAARLVLSGPAGGVVGALAVARQALATDTPDILTFDMGGTSTDVALCPGEVPRTVEGSISGLPLRLPSIDIHTVGAGGGSIARVDVGGALRVGPASAGAVPGPACYGRGGTLSTVTDANLVLGRLQPRGFLGGRGAVQLDVAAARAAVRPLAAALDVSLEEAAHGVLSVANATMERALRRVSVERGHDPRSFVLVPFGGAGPLHACDVAGALGVRRILVPLHPGVLSAWGLLVADVVHDEVQAVLRPAAELAAEPAPLAGTIDGLAERATAVLAAEGVASPALAAELDLRYVGQSHELRVPLPLPVTPDNVQAALSAFATLHERRWGFSLDGEPMEIVAARVRASGPGAGGELPRIPARGESGDGSPDCAVENARLGPRPVWFPGRGAQPVEIWDRARLRAGDRFAGPAIVLQYDTTLVVPPGWEATVDPWGNLSLEAS